MNKQIKITIAIPAYNEEQNIPYLLDSLLKQKGPLFEIEKIIVVSDASTDKTVEIVKNYHKKYKFIEIIDGNKRIGKNQRLNQIYRLNKSEILIIFDGDFLLSSSFAIEKLVEKFSDPQVALASCNKIPLKPTNFIGKLIKEIELIWDEIKKDLAEGNNIHNFNIAAFAIRKSFAKKLAYPKNIYTITNFTYSAAIKKNLKVKFVKEANVFFRLPNNIYDYLLQSKRYSNTLEKDVHYYGKVVYDMNKIPLLRKVLITIKMVIKNPFYASLAIILKILINFAPPVKNNIDTQTWIPVLSTKKCIKK